MKTILSLLYNMLFFDLFIVQKNSKMTIYKIIIDKIKIEIEEEINLNLLI